MIANMIAADTSSGGDRVAIIGGGVVGCVIALRLAAAGQQVTLFEAAPSLGGLASPWELGPLVWDRHYHVICESDTTLRSLLEELELESEIVWSSVRTGFFSNGKLHEFTNVKDFLAFPPLRMHEKLRLGAAIVYASKVAPHTLRKITAAAWLTRLCGRRVYTQVWEPLLRAKLGANATSVAASFIAVTIRRLFGARTNTSGAERFGYIPGGYARIFDVLTRKMEQLGIDIRCNVAIERIETDAGGLDVRSKGGAQRFDRTVVTVPAPVISALVPELSATERATLNSVPYAGVVCASVLLDKPLSPYYITNITDQWVPFSAIIGFSNITGSAEFRGKALVYLPKYVAPNDPLFNQDDESIRAAFISALIRMVPGFDPASISAFRVSRVRNVFPFPIASAPYDVPTFATSVPNVSIATAAQIDDATLNVDRSVALANAAAGYVLQGRPREAAR